MAEQWFNKLMRDIRNNAYMNYNYVVSLKKKKGLTIKWIQKVNKELEKMGSNVQFWFTEGSRDYHFSIGRINQNEKLTEDDYAEIAEFLVMYELEDYIET